MERFLFDLQWPKKKVGLKKSKNSILEGIQYDCIDVLNLIGSSVVSLLGYTEMCDLYKWYSNGNAKDGNIAWDILG